MKSLKRTKLKKINSNSFKPVHRKLQVLSWPETTGNTWGFDPSKIKPKVHQEQVLSSNQHQNSSSMVIHLSLIFRVLSVVLDSFLFRFGPSILFQKSSKKFHFTFSSKLKKLSGNETKWIIELRNIESLKNVPLPSPSMILVSLLSTHNHSFLFF